MDLIKLLVKHREKRSSCVPTTRYETTIRAYKLKKKFTSLFESSRLL